MCARAGYIYIYTLNWLHLGKEVIRHSVDLAGIQILRAAHLINHPGKVFQYQLPWRIREFLSEREQVMATTTADIHQQRLIGTHAGYVQEAVLDREPVPPMGPVGALAFHETVETR